MLNIHVIFSSADVHTTPALDLDSTENKILRQVTNNTRAGYGMVNMS